VQKIASHKTLNATLNYSSHLSVLSYYLSVGSKAISSNRYASTYGTRQDY